MGSTCTAGTRTRAPHAARLLPFLAAALALTACGPTCGDELARIAALGSGETLTLDRACIVRGDVVIPAGATVIGGTFEVGPGDGAPEHVTLAPSADPLVPTTLRGAQVITTSTYGIGLIAAGHARVSSVDVTLSAGTGIAAFGDGAALVVDACNVVGDVDPDRLLELTDPPDPSTTAIYGIAAEDGAEVTITGGTVRRTAFAAIASLNATAHVEDVTIVQALGIGALAFGGSLEVASAEIEGSLSSVSRAAMGLASADGGTLTVATSTVHDGEGFGAFVTGASASIATTDFTALGQGGVWADVGADVEITGASLSAIGGAAIAAVGADAITVRDTDVVGTTLAPIPLRTGLSAEQMGDALHLAQLGGVAMAIDLSDLMLADNARIGLLLDGDDATLAPTIGTIAIIPPDGALGAVAQRTTSIPATWDDTIDRNGSDARDAAAPVLAVSDGNPFGILMPPTIEP